MKLIVYDGLSINPFTKFQGRTLKNKVVPGLIMRFPQIESVEYRHWKDKNIVDDPDTIVLGHSLGAYAAWLTTLHCALLFTYDVRWTGSKNKEGYSKRLEAGLHFNFYQKKFLNLPGYHVTGVQNYKLTEGVSHMSLPYHYDVRNMVYDEVKGVML